MEIVLALAGLVASHALVLAMVRNMRREGQHIRRYQVGLLLAADALVGVLIYVSGNWQVFLWLTVGAGVAGLVQQLRPPSLPPR